MSNQNLNFIFRLQHWIHDFDLEWIDLAETFIQRLVKLPCEFDKR